MAALAGEHFQTADLLCHKGADLDVQGHSGSNLLHAAAFSGNIKVLRKLIEYGFTDIDAEKDGGYTPLHCASDIENLSGGSVLRLLLEHGAGINVRELNGTTPLHVASKFGNLEAMHVLLEHGADVEVKNNGGETALQVAASHGGDKAVELLREHGAE